MTGTRLYLLDIEGTVAPVSLVTEQLFRFAHVHFAEFLAEKRDDADVLADLALLAEENKAETDAGRPLFEGVGEGRGWTEAVAYGQWLMARDRKSTALKSLQGRIWKSGFESGELKGTLFEDVPPALERWSQRAHVAIYSSGSAAAQRMLFQYSTFGDLTERIKGYFDTRTGAKVSSESYAAIAEAMGVEAGEALFLSDVVRELDAAREAGCQTRLVVREGNAPVNGGHGHAVVTSFDVL
jgi:enolase-phosphatase E1